MARRIARLMTDGSTVWENGAPRPVRFGDVCILLRSPKNKAQVSREAFLKEGINSWSDSRNGFLQAREIRVMVAFLQMLDNPYRDIPLFNGIDVRFVWFYAGSDQQRFVCWTNGALFTLLSQEKRPAKGTSPAPRFCARRSFCGGWRSSMPVARTSGVDLRQNRLSGDCVRLSDGTGEKGESASALQLCGSF